MARGYACIYNVPIVRYEVECWGRYYWLEWALGKYDGYSACLLELKSYG